MNNRILSLVGSSVLISSCALKTTNIHGLPKPIDDYEEAAKLHMKKEYPNEAIAHFLKPTVNWSRSSDSFAEADLVQVTYTALGNSDNVFKPSKNITIMMKPDTAFHSAYLHKFPRAKK